MDEYERKLLERLVKSSEENNRILRGMRRSATVSRLFHLLYWVAIIAIAVVSYNYIQPYLGKLNTAMQAVDQLRALPFQNGTQAE